MNALIRKYFDWLRERTIPKAIDDQWIQITTPHLDRHNDCLQIYAKKDEKGILLSDDGYIINDLISSGCDLKSAKRQEFLKTITHGFGVQLENEKLLIHASVDDFPVKKHNIIQAMLAVNDLFCLASPHTKNLFVEDVTKWLDSANIRYVPRAKFSGKSGFDHMFDYVVPKSQQYPERFVQILNNPDKETVQFLVFKWLDTRETRESESKLFAVLNNASMPVSQSILDALHNYDLEPILWTERQKSQKILAA